MRHNYSDLNFGVTFFGTQCRYEGCVVVSKAKEFGEKRKIRAITLFKVIQGHRGRYQSKARMRLPISD